MVLPAAGASEKCPSTMYSRMEKPAIGMANATHSAAPRISLRRQPVTTISTNSSAGRMRIWPTWANGALRPSASPPATISRGPGRGRQSSRASPATMQASNHTSGMMVCSICSW